MPAMAAAIRAGVLYFVVVFAAGFVLGTLRVLALVPALGETAAVALELPFMLAVAWLTCRSLLRRLAVPATVPARLAMGTLAFALLISAELALAVALGGSPGAALAALATTPGLLGLIGQIAFALMPLALLGQ
jgi:hypothetical protein